MSFSYELIRKQFGWGDTQDYYRIADANDNRIATCYREENAKLVVDLMLDGLKYRAMLANKPKR